MYTLCRDGKYSEVNDKKAFKNILDPQCLDACDPKVFKVEKQLNFLLVQLGCQTIRHGQFGQISANLTL